MIASNNQDSSGVSRAGFLVGVPWVVAALNYLDRIMITTMRGSIKARRRECSCAAF